MDVAALAEKHLIFLLYVAVAQSLWRFGLVLFAYIGLESYVSWFEKRPCTIAPCLAIPDNHDPARCC